MSKEFQAARTRGHERVHDHARASDDADAVQRLPRRPASQVPVASTAVALGAAAGARRAFGDAVNAGIHPGTADAIAPGSATPTATEPAAVAARSTDRRGDPGAGAEIDAGSAGALEARPSDVGVAAPSAPDRAARPPGATRDPREVARRGVDGGGGRLPWLDRLQRAFGKHDLASVTAHVGGAAAEAARALDTTAYALGDHVAFAHDPDLFTAAHEAAHVIQQRGGVQLAGGIDARDDAYEQHADRVAAAVVRGVSVEHLLDAGPRGGGSGGGGAVVQRDTGRDRTERAQTWDPTIAGPLDADAAATAETDAAAIRANVALGLTGDRIRALRHALGLEARPRMAHAIDRDVVRGLRRVQGAAGSGVLDEATVFQLDLGVAWHGRVGAGRYRRTPPWAALDAVMLEHIRAEVVPALRVTDADLVLSPGRRSYAVVSERFIQQVVSWQFWHQRREVVVWGLLDADDLARHFGVTTAAAEPAPADATGRDAASATGGPEAAIAEDDQAADALATADAPGAEAAGTDDTEAANRAQLAQLQRDLAGYVRQRAALRGDAVAQAALDHAWQARAQAAPMQAMQLGVDNERIHAAQYAARPYMRARWTEEAIREAGGATLRPLPARHRRRAGASTVAGAPEAAGSAPGLERRDADAVRAHLRESSVVVDQNADGSYRRTELVRGATGWEGRAIQGGRAGTVAPTADVRQEAVTAIAGLETLHDQLEHWGGRLQAAINAPETLAATLAALSQISFDAPRTLRRPLALGLPRALDAAQWSTPARARATAVVWRGALRRAIPTVTRALTTHRGYLGNPERRNPNAVRVDLSRTGVRVTNNGGRQLGPDEMHLDETFAEAMLRFLEMVRGLGATEMRTAGFLREPISPADTHPWGRACDITGFVFGGRLIALRNGREDPDGYTAPNERWSDWFNHRDQIDGQTCSQILHALTARMASYFSGITGPGHDAAHGNHWHVELVGGRARETIHAIQDQPEDATETAEDPAAPPGA